MKKNKLLLISVILNIILLFYAGKIIYDKGGIDYIKWKLRLGEKPSKPFNNDYYEIRKSVHNIMPRTSNSIVFLGDSMTEYCNWNELFNNPNIINRGISGDVIKGAIGRIDKILDAKPAQLFVMMGVNDLQKYESIQKVISDYKNLLTKILEKSPQTAVFVLSILPTDNREKAKNIDIVTINKGLTKLANHLNLTFIDLYDLFTDHQNNLNPNYTVDGVHLNGEGYLVWKKAIEKYVYNATI